MNEGPLETEAPEREFRSPEGAPYRFSVTVKRPGGDRKSVYGFRVTGGDPSTGEEKTRNYRLARKDPQLALNLLARLARDFGTRIPLNRRPRVRPTFRADYHELITESLTPEILYGYGDPAVLRVSARDPGEDRDWYYAVLTSNDAPNAFPIIRSDDLKRWEHVGFAFPKGKKPSWSVEGEHVADYWAPELHRIGSGFGLYFVARHRDTRELCIGVATACSPAGPFVAEREPLLRGGTIDPHVLVEREGTAVLYWKEDRNDIWRNELNELLYRYPRLIGRLLPSEEDRRTASFVATLWPWSRELEPMERFVQQVLIEAVTTDFPAFELRLKEVLGARDQVRVEVRRKVQSVLESLKTPIYAQKLDPKGLRLVGEAEKVLENDQLWEAHVIEGVWVVDHEGRYYLFYAGNDFSTAEYGIGVAVADSPFGPFRKLPAPFLRTTRKWLGPGHPSVAIGPHGEHVLFFHAFPRGQSGYKGFRALLAAPILFEDGIPVLGSPTVR